MQIINLTPHDLVIYDKNTDIREIIKRIKTSGMASIISIREKSKIVFDYPMTVPTIKKVINLPAAKDNVLYFVSNMIRTALPNRIDLISPSSNRESIDDIVRDDEGKILGLRAFDSNY